MLQCFPISDHVSFPREHDSLFQVYPYSDISFTTVGQRNYTLGNDTWSEMGKHCHITKKVYCLRLYNYTIILNNNKNVSFTKYIIYMKFHFINNYKIFHKYLMIYMIYRVKVNIL